MSQQHQQPISAGTAQQPVEPNLFELSNQEIHVTYSSTSFTGQAQLSYHSPTQRDQGGPLCRAVGRISSQLGRLSGDFGENMPGPPF